MCPTPPRNLATTAWDTDKIAKCLQAGVGRAAYLDELEAAFAAKQNAFTEKREEEGVDARWKLWIETIKEMAAKHLARGSRGDKKTVHKELTERRSALLKKLAEWRQCMTRLLPELDDVETLAHRGLRG